jgi:hypothetical protein
MTLSPGQKLTFSEIATGRSAAYEGADRVVVTQKGRPGRRRVIVDTGFWKRR